MTTQELADLRSKTEAAAKILSAIDSAKYDKKAAMAAESFLVSAKSGQSAVFNSETAYLSISNACRDELKSLCVAYFQERITILEAEFQKL